MARVAGFGGRNPSTTGGRLASTTGISHPAPPPKPRSAVISGFGGRNASTTGGRLPGLLGGGQPSTAELLNSVEGFSLVLESNDGERTVYATDKSPRKGLTALSVTLAVNGQSHWKASLPADRELYDWSYSDVVVGHSGDRLFHGRLLPVGSPGSGNQVTVEGPGRLYRLTSGYMEVSVRNVVGWEAINQFWEQVAEKTDGKIRGYAVKPPTGTERPIGDEPFEASGTPMEVGQELHNQFGYCFVADPTDRAGVVESFRPGTQTREATWQSKDDSVNIEVDPTGYHNKVIVRGAKNPPQAQRYRGVATAPEWEIEALAGEVVLHEPPPDENLTSDQACLAKAQSLLEEGRGEWSIGGSFDATPVGVLPGYVYEVSEFAKAAPPGARPVQATLRKVTHTLIGEPKTQLDFNAERGIVQSIRQAQGQPFAANRLQRQQESMIPDSAGGDSATAYANTYPHSY